MAAQAKVDVGGILRPQGRLDLATALQPYPGTLGERAAAHLLRRAGFGGTPAEIARYGAMRAVDAAATLLAVPNANSIAPPEQAQVDGPLAQRETRESLAALQLWWLNRMLNSPAPLQEKMTLYFHGHFTSRATPRFPRITYNQNALFRRYATGNLRELTHEVSKDAAMLIFLDGASNVASHPNENYARELMELFTLGVDNYTEDDVRESARAWTGWRVVRKGDAVVFDEARHDAGRKTFLGRTGNFNGDDIVDIIFDQPQCARFFATSLLNWFVYNDPEPELIDAVARLMRAHRYELAPVLGVLLASNVFYSERSYRALVKSPVEFVVGTYKTLGLSEIGAMAIPSLAQMGQRLFFPPSVAGWPGGKNWLTSGTMIDRQNFLTRLLGSQTLRASSWLRQLPVAPKSAASVLAQIIVQNDVSPASRSELEAYLGGAGSAALPSLSAENYDERITGAVYLAMATPAYQLN
ncbi:MAG: DUF1800 domain-containing protein [Candidatus Eremiobacteraeota bacterium]|nr:DUF1800 domain-containing protein [Candidatus Eremiobacteraeota bacterium]